MASEWYYSKSGEKCGPVSDSAIKDMAKSGGLLPSDLVWEESMSDWKPAESVKGLFARAESANPQGKRPPPISSHTKPHDNSTSGSSPSFNSSSKSGDKLPEFPLQLDAASLFAFLNKMAKADVTEFVTHLVAALGKWICLAIGLIFILSAIHAEMAPASAAAAGVACFFGICARICQAEQYRRQ